MSSASSGMTMAQKVLAEHAGRDEVSDGEVVEVPVDVAMAHEACAQLVGPFEEMGAEEVWDPDKVVIPIDHWVPASSESSARLHRIVRDFVEEHDLHHFYDVGGDHGICHQILVEEGFCLPGDIVVGTDSHTNMAGALGSFACGIGPTEMASVFALGECWFKVPGTIRVDITGSYGFPVMSKDLILHLLGELTTRGAIYKSVEFGGPGLASMPMYQRLTITNMTTELGAKVGMIEPDEITMDYLESLPDIKNGRGDEVYEHADLGSDPDAGFERTMHVDLDELEPLVARPQSPDNVYPVQATDTGPVDQVFVGSCTNARLEDLRVVASILEGERIADDTRLLVYPASQRIYREAMAEGIAEVIMEAGGVFNASSCGACFGGMGGVLDEGEVCVSTSNRNFPGRMGHVDSESYLVSPATAAVTALYGELVDPRQALSSKEWRQVDRASREGLAATA
jgi:3-isopropylmalate/(R)-2-methylmalate dehydratase large subunit